MRWTIYYSLMICCLAATLWMVTFGSAEIWSNMHDDGHGALAFDSCSAAAQPAIHIIKPTETPAAIVPVAKPEVRHIEAGTSRQEVLAMLGSPSYVDAVNDRWSYGSTMLMFKDDHVTGSLKLDPTQAARLHDLQMSSTSAFSANTVSTPAPATSARKSSNKIKPSASMRKSRSQKATLWEPMFRKFYSDQPLPRSKKHYSRYNGMPGYRDHRYTESNKIFRRH